MKSSPLYQILGSPGSYHRHETPKNLLSCSPHKDLCSFLFPDFGQKYLYYWGSKLQDRYQIGAQDSGGGGFPPMLDGSGLEESNLRRDPQNETILRDSWSQTRHLSVCFTLKCKAMADKSLMQSLLVGDDTIVNNNKLIVAASKVRLCINRVGLRLRFTKSLNLKFDNLNLNLNLNVTSMPKIQKNELTKSINWAISS